MTKLIKRRILFESTHSAPFCFTRQTGRAQPNKEDKDEFFKSLKQSAGGHLTLPMLFFYKYLLKHGEEDGSPLIDKDLFFYIEVQKFKVSAGNLNRGIL